jgi:uncharacterized protein YfbU (UPF0304 family)
MLVNDYKLKQIFDAGNLEEYVEVWLRMAIVDFNRVRTLPLSYSPISKTFSEVLTDEEISILSQLMVKYWLTKEVNDVLAMENVLQDHDFTRHSEAQNLDAKRNLLNRQTEDCKQLLIQYGYDHFVWNHV